MLDLRTYGLKVHMTLTAEGNISWDGDWLSNHSIRFDMDEFHSMVHSLLAAARRILHADLLFNPSASDIPHVPWKLLTDNPANANPNPKAAASTTGF